MEPLWSLWKQPGSSPKAQTVLGRTLAKPLPGRRPRENKNTFTQKPGCGCSQQDPAPQPEGRKSLNAHWQTNGSNMQHTHTLECHSAVRGSRASTPAAPRMSCDDTWLSQRSQTQKARCRTAPSTSSVPNRPVQRDRE